MTTILVVDDEPDICMLVNAVLSRSGFEVAQASSGADALQRIGSGPTPDLVMLDVQMPVMDGWETLRRLRQDSRLSLLPVLMCTVKARQEDGERGWSLGCDGYLTKPFAIDDLTDEIEAILARTPDERLAVRRSRALAAQEQLRSQETS